MNILKALLSFLLDEWLWSMTWGWYQILLGLIFTWLLFIGVSRMKSLPALILTVTSYWSAFVVYTLFIVLCSSYVIQTNYVPAHHAVNNIAVSFGLAVVFTLLQVLFFTLINTWYRVKHSHVFLITLLGNSIAALIATYCMRCTLFIN